MTTSTTPAEPPTRLISHFTDRGREDQISGWSELWSNDESDLWDRGKPSPALLDWIESKPASLPSPKDGKRLKALIPGCGKGYDVTMLALHGFDVYGLEVSPIGGEVARKHAQAELSNPSDYNFADPSCKPEAGPGEVQIIVGDFFKRDWEKDCIGPDREKFDLIYDYTFLCALLPEMRKDWGRRMSELLAPNGVLVCVEFPQFKKLTDSGPPWPLQGVHWNLLAEGGDGIIKEEPTEGGKQDGLFERLEYFKPPRTYERGRGTDTMSVWSLKK